MRKKKELPDKWMKLSDVVNRIMQTEKCDTQQAWDRLLPYLRSGQIPARAEMFTIVEKEEEPAK